MIHSLYEKVHQVAAIEFTAHRLTKNTALTVGLLSLAGVIGLVTVCLASPANTHPTTSQDAAFVRRADEAEIGDVRLAVLALHKSDNRLVVSFATRIRDVDSQLHLELSSIAKAQHVAFPSAVGSSFKSQLDQLAQESGSKFNMGYLKSELRADKQVLSVYKREVTEGDNIYVTAFAKETIPIIDQHIWLAQQGIASVAKRSRPSLSRAGK